MRCLLVTLAIYLVAATALLEVAHTFRRMSAPRRLGRARCGPNEHLAASQCDDLFCDDDWTTGRDCSLDRFWESCWCNEGHRRNHNYECVAEIFCNGTCAENERPLVPGSNALCEYTCSDPDGRCHSIMDDTADCLCAPGFYRDVKGCVKRSDCSPPPEEPIEPLV